MSEDGHDWVQVQKPHRCEHAETKCLHNCKQEQTTPQSMSWLCIPASSLVFSSSASSFLSDSLSMTGAFSTCTTSAAGHPPSKHSKCPNSSQPYHATSLVKMERIVPDPSHSSSGEHIESRQLLPRQALSIPPSWRIWSAEGKESHQSSARLLCYLSFEAFQARSQEQAVNKAHPLQGSSCLNIVAQVWAVMPPLKKISEMHEGRMAGGRIPSAPGQNKGRQDQAVFSHTKLTAATTLYVAGQGIE